MLIETKEKKCKCVLCGRATIHERVYSCKNFVISHGICFECEDNNKFLGCGVIEPIIEIMRKLIGGNNE
jgi:hypothetical protein